MCSAATADVSDVLGVSKTQVRRASQFDRDRRDDRVGVANDDSNTSGASS
ncbi:hypothetical protein H6F43_13775 [Leptolyngbya sp. FACHB-36]|nr:hypothetical protein [Leptolyngbya sp. FACHB-36]MBD2021246.1 hypothetical protein [Leptolyngbya sp. FACHB-36]